ncbi:type I-U CRISPR-associated protein Csb2 [Corynebacterium sp.]|uniref:type I-G CRISPR-associated protein Csb2 n=1 Tax=Corynebacterium sp. TaxID=1720 RepID=UPI0026DAA993|nr:type I-U CRISPR-associated protein Csb2 [Corynebacterium sp.]MDO5076186.1 type I-U CRISPR-associated protein Csb2 [Corynebacterium sp.]
MRALNLVARYPLGVFQGHKRDKRPDWMPDPARLHAALLNSAAQGCCAVEANGRLAPTETSLKALRWLEENPPSGIQLPEAQWVSPATSRFAYRKVSSINKKRLTENRPVSDGVAMAGTVGWHWENVPDDIADTVELLAQDVSCLGEAQSVAVIEPGEVRPTLLLDIAATPFTRGGTLVRVPASGRTEHLISEYLLANPKKLPTVTADKKKDGESPRPPRGTHDCVQELQYKQPNARIVDAPWNKVVLFELAGPTLRSDQHVPVCVAMHRAIISTLGYGASSMVTGKYGTTTETQPANRLAIQYLNVEHVERFGLNTHALALLLPRDATDIELHQLVRGLTGVKELWGREIGRRRLYFHGTTVAADEFWPKPAPGTVRFWVPQTVVIPETRPVRSANTNKSWSLADAGLLSLSYVWRDECDRIGKGQQLYRSLRDQIAQRGAFVHDARTLPVSATNYVHRSNKSLTVQPWTGLFYLGDLMKDSTIVAVGQSRHLGGGLLVPMDIPKEFALALMAQHKEIDNVAN